MKERFYVVVLYAAGYKWRIYDRDDDRRMVAYYTRREAREACAKLNSGELTWEDVS